MSKDNQCFVSMTCGKCRFKTTDEAEADGHRISCKGKQTPKPDLAKLKQVCPEMVKKIYDPDDEGGDTFLTINDDLSLDNLEAIAIRLLALAEENERLKKELGFKYSKQCLCGYTVTIIPNECQDGSS